MQHVTKYELRATLFVAGYSQAAFARFIGRSPAFVNGMCSYSDDQVPLRWVVEIERMLGREGYELALATARQKIEEARARRRWFS